MAEESHSNRDRFHMWLGAGGVVFLLGLAALLLYGVLRLINQFVVFFRVLDPKLATQIVATSGTVLAAILAVVVGQLIAKNREVREAHRQKKTELYNGLLDLIKDAMKSKDNNNPSAEAAQIDFFQEFNSSLILWGSSGVIRAYHEWHRLLPSQTQGGASLEAMFAMDKLFRAFRSDLGTSSRRLKKGALIQMYLKPGELEKQSTTKQDDVATK